MRKLLSILGLLIILAGPAWAQAPTTNQQFKVVMNHDGKDTTGYRLWIDQQQVGTDIPVSALVNGEVTTPATSIAVAGKHTIEISAFGPGGQTFSDTLTIDVIAPPMPAPAKPTNIRIQLVATVDSQGVIRLHIMSVDSSLQK